MVTEFLTGIVIIGVFIAFAYFIWHNIELSKKKRLQHALLAFQSHTNPHFIKNVLQAINWFILNNEKQKASDYLCDFARLMEDILLFSKKNILTLDEKLRFLDLYIKLQHLRHTDKFDYVSIESADVKNRTVRVAKNINPEVFMLPPLLIHPFIENAIEHGLKPRTSKGFLLVEFEYSDSKLICRISDNGIGVKASKKRQHLLNTNSSNTGMESAKERIKIIKKLYGINIISNITELYPGEKEPGTLVCIEFPMPVGFSSESGMPKETYQL